MGQFIKQWYDITATIMLLLRREKKNMFISNAIKAPCFLMNGVKKKTCKKEESQSRVFVKVFAENSPGHQRLHTHIL